MTLASLLEDVLGPDLPVGVRAYDGTRIGPEDPPATIVLHRPEALQRIVTGRGELGFARAYVAGDIDIEGDIFAALRLRDRLPEVKLRLGQKLHAARIVGLRNLWPPLPPPPEEVQLSGRRFSRGRRSEALSRHYDIPTAFYELFLGRTMAYTCALFGHADDSLDDAQDAKYELTCQKLALQPGMRLLDVGCGWGGMLFHAARHHGVRGVGVSLALPQVEWARKRATETGLAHLVEIRQQDYRDIDDGPYDAICSMGVFEHVGFEGDAFFPKLHGLLRPGGRLVNHAISQPPFRNAAPNPDGFIQRYVFPDSELHEVGHVVSAIQEAGCEVRHLESLREHYPLTLRHWVRNLEDELGRGRRAGRARAGTGVAVVHGRFRAQLRVQRHPDPSGAGRPSRSGRHERPAAAPQLLRSRQGQSGLPDFATMSGHALSGIDVCLAPDQAAWSDGVCSPTRSIGVFRPGAELVRPVRPASPSQAARHPGRPPSSSSSAWRATAAWRSCSSSRSRCSAAGHKACDCPPRGPAMVAQRDEDVGSTPGEGGAEAEPVELAVGTVLDVAPVVVDGSPTEVEDGGGCDNLSLHGRTSAQFAGGPGATVTNQKAKVSKACKPACPKGTPCVKVTGTLESTYSATVTIVMPSLPGGLTECEQGHVQDFLDNVLKPHEGDHERRLKSYDGTTKIPVNVTACGMAEATKKIEKIHLDEDAKRQDAARALSKKIDPFKKTVDCSDCDEE